MIKKKMFLGILSFSFIFVVITFSSAEELKCDDYSGKHLTKEQAQKVLEICTAEIKKDEIILQKKEGETRGVANEVYRLDKKIQISKNYIYQKTLKIEKLKRTIGENKADVKNIDSDIDRLVNSLKKMVYKKYQYQNYTTVETIFSKKTISEFFQTMELIEFLEKKISKEVKKYDEKKKDLEFLLGELEERDALEKELVLEKKEESESISKNKKYKTELLGILKKEVGVQKVQIADKEKIKKEILKRTFTVASGAKVTFGEAYYILKPYKKDIGVDPAFVLAILFQESGYKGKIGGNIGGCTYKQKNPCGKNEVMRSSQQPSFEKIMGGLGLSASKQKVSCPICKDGSYGGAMGPAQFMPATWMGIRDKAGAIIGKKGSDMSPFTNHDAFIASATLLKSNYYSSACTNYANQYKHIQSTRTLRERCAAAMYYAGRGNWYKHRMGYGQSVVTRADRFRKDIKQLES